MLGLFLKLKRLKSTEWILRSYRCQNQLGKGQPSGANTGSEEEEVPIECESETPRSSKSRRNRLGRRRPMTVRVGGK